MPYCTNCGRQLSVGAKYCSECGTPTSQKSTTSRQHSYEGKIYKCPNCGELLHSFVRNCPSCGLELRGTHAASAVKEFALKLEATEARRVYEKRPKSFSRYEWISKTDEQKINIIHNFAVPNTKEDMLEFMILASSNINVKALNSTFRSERAIAEAWASKAKQIYEKAKASYGDQQDFQTIQDLYDKTFTEIKKAHTLSWKTPVITLVAIFGFLFGLIFFIELIVGPIACRKENIRLSKIEQDAIVALDRGEYKKALLYAESIVFDAGVNTNDTKKASKEWEIQRELLIEQIIDEATRSGIILQRDNTSTQQQSEDKMPVSSGFFEGAAEGFMDGATPGVNALKDGIAEFNKIMGDTTVKGDESLDQTNNE